MVRFEVGERVLLDGEYSPLSNHKPTYAVVYGVYKSHVVFQPENGLKRVSYTRQQCSCIKKV